MLLNNLENTEHNSILILGRNNFDINKYIDNNFKIDSNGYIKINNSSKNIRFLTAIRTLKYS